MRGFKNFKGSDARCPSIHFLFYGDAYAILEGPTPNLTTASVSPTTIIHWFTCIIRKYQGQRKIDNWGAGGGHIFVFTECKNNRFQKKLIVQNTTYEYAPPLSIFCRP